MERDAAEQVENREQDERSESLQQQGHQPHLEHVGVKQHQEEDELVEQQADVLNAKGNKHKNTFNEIQVRECHCELLGVSFI